MTTNIPPAGGWGRPSGTPSSDQTPPTAAPVAPPSFLPPQVGGWGTPPPPAGGWAPPPAPSVRPDGWPTQPAQPAQPAQPPAPPPPPVQPPQGYPAPQPGPGGAMDVIDYRIQGAEMQYVEVDLDPGEAAVGEAGSMMYLDAGVGMEAVFGDGSRGAQAGGFLDKLMGAGKRLLTGESLFTTVFTNQTQYKRTVAFAAPYPGCILAMDLRRLGGTLICQKDAFLCAARGVSLGIFFQRKLGVGFFGGEGFIMQRLDGDGLAFVHCSGTVLRRDLAPGETLMVDTGCLVAMTPDVQFDIQYVGNVKTALFGGEGLFFARVAGPGIVWLQSLPFSRLASRIFAAAPQGGGRNRDEGGPLGGLGRMLGGDNSE